MEQVSFQKTIEYYCKKFAQEFQLIPIIGCELEFYTIKKTSLQKLQQLVSKNKTISVIDEQGKNQFELLFSPTNDLIKLIETIYHSKELLKTVALFDAKPFEEEPSSALHIHINFLDTNLNNIFEKQNGKNPKILGYVIGGLLHLMKESCIFFAPDKEAYKRYTIESMNTPATISWGINNRTAALRITTMEKGPRRIEHRVASSNAAPEKVIAAILAASYIGINRKIHPQEPTYGKTFDPQYNLKKLPQSLEEAQSLMLQSDLYHLLAPQETPDGII